MTTKPLNVVVGLPDDGRLQVSHLQGSEIQFSLEGTANFIEQVPNARAWHYIWVGRRAPAQSSMLPGPVLNYVAEADRCRAALEAARDIAATLGRSWFNHPAHVLRTTRDEVSVALQGIDGLDVPRTIRVSPRTAQDILAAIETHDLGYPVLVRPVGEHGSKSLVRLDGPDQDGLFALPWGGEAFYITQFRDFRGTDGLFRKMRLAVIGGHPFLRHAISDRTWNLTPATRSKDPHLSSLEAAAMDTFEAALLPKVMPTVRAIHERLQLDYLGIDCAIEADGRMTLFEANATMTMLRRRPLPNVWDRSVLAMQAALLALLDEPDRWAATTR